MISLGVAWYVTARHIDSLGFMLVSCSDIYTAEHHVCPSIWYRSLLAIHSCHNTYSLTKRSWSTWLLGFHFARPRRVERGGSGKKMKGEVVHYAHCKMAAWQKDFVSSDLYSLLFWFIAS